MHEQDSSRPGLVPLVAAAVAVPSVVLVAEAVIGEGPPGDGPSGRPAVVQELPALTSSIPAGARDVGVTAPLVITAEEGAVANVRAAGPGGRALTGTRSPDGTRWTSEPLDFGTEYTVTAEGAGSDGRPLPPLTTTFRTVDPTRELSVESVRPTDGQVVGVAMPISIYFSRDVTDKAAVERRLSVSPSTPTEGSFRWVSDNQVNWRPKEYWTTGTTVTVSARLRGLDLGHGTFGVEDTASRFTVGRHQEAVGDARAHTLTLYADGAPIRTLPASFGRAQYPTQSGTHVAFEKHEVKRMRSDTWGGPAKGEPGYYDQLLPLAVRISSNGEFVHVNPETVGQQGRANVSHGCVNLSPANGRLFYDWVQIGDPVTIVGTSRPLTPGDGDIADWLIPWDRYVLGSAL